MIILASLLLVQVQGSLPDSFGAWKSVAPATTVSREWAGRREEALKAVKALASDSAESRQKKLKDWRKRCLADRPSPTDAYRAAHYLLAFKEGCRQAGAESIFLAALANTRGSSDPEFMRMAYAGLCIGADPQKWPGLGLRLLSIFKDDSVLKKSFVIDCAVGQTTYEECVKGLAMVSDVEQTPAKVASANATIRCRMYELKKKKSDLDLAISLFEQAIALETDAHKKKVGQSWLADLKKKRDAGKFVSG
jgi:hypothetical protein